MNKIDGKGQVSAKDVSEIDVSESAAMIDLRKSDLKKSEPENILADVANVPAFQLGGWTVFPARNLIRWTASEPMSATPAEEQRQLEPRLMRLLCLLASAADSVVTREEITEKLWPSVIVNENSLTRAVSDLRRTLLAPGATSSTRKSDALIETVPKRGYRLSVMPQVAIATQAIKQRSLAARAQDGALALPVRPTAMQWLHRWTPSIAACLILALAVILRTGDGGPSSRDPSPLLAHLGEMGQLSETGSGVNLAKPEKPALLDTGKPDAQPAHPAGYKQWQDLVLPSHEQTGSEISDNALDQTAEHLGITALGTADSTMLKALRTSTSALGSGQSMLTPDGQLLAYVDHRDGISSLTLRPALSTGEPWVAFTTDENIYHLQWSPLDAGILVTVGQDSKDNDHTAYLRLMLLDLDTLMLHELYRRDIPADDDWLRSTGKLT